MLTILTCYRSRYHRPRGFRNFLGEVFVFGEEFVRLFGLTTAGSSTSVTGAKLLIQCFCGKSFSGIFCTQTSGCNFKSICVSFVSVGDCKNFDRVDIFLSVRSKMLVVVEAAAAN